MISADLGQLHNNIFTLVKLTTIFLPSKRQFIFCPRAPDQVHKVLLFSVYSFSNTQPVQSLRKSWIALPPKHYYYISNFVFLLALYNV